MLDFKFNPDDPLYKGFNLTALDQSQVQRIVSELNMCTKSVTWVLRKIWIDENLTDNCKCYLLFTLGRMYQLEHI